MSKGDTGTAAGNANRLPGSSRLQPSPSGAGCGGSPPARPAAPAREIPRPCPPNPGRRSSAPLRLRGRAVNGIAAIIPVKNNARGEGSAAFEAGIAAEKGAALKCGRGNFSFNPENKDGSQASRGGGVGRADFRPAGMF